MIRNTYGRLFALAAIAAVMMTSRSSQAAPGMAAMMTLTSAVANEDLRTNALLQVYVDDAATVDVSGTDIHDKELTKLAPGSRLYNLRHLRPNEFRQAVVSAAYLFQTAGGKQLITLTKSVMVQAGKFESVRFTMAEFNRARPLPRINNPIALYNFREGGGRMVFDEAKKLRKPLDLYIHDESKTKWSKHRGLQVTGKVRIASVGHADELVNALDQTDEITIEAWIKPDKVRQNGPARIVSLSDGISLRDFTLGQNGDAYDVRLRATQLGSGAADQNNGIPSVSTQPQTVSTNNMAHVVYTRSKSGQARIYIDGIQRANDLRLGGFSIWDDRFHLLLSNEATLDRTWLGSYYLVAIYDRALTEPEIKQNYRAKP